MSISLRFAVHTCLYSLLYRNSHSVPTGIYLVFTSLEWLGQGGSFLVAFLQNSICPRMSESSLYMENVTEKLQYMHMVQHMYNLCTTYVHVYTLYVQVYTVYIHGLISCPNWFSCPTQRCRSRTERYPLCRGR
jgi:hypothetical protein